MKVEKSDEDISKQEDWLDFDVTASELARLFGRSPGAIRAWSKYKNLVRNPNGKFNLRGSIRWLENHYRQAATVKITLSALTQNQLAELLGVSKQRISDWRGEGLPRDDDGLYDVGVVLCWLPKFFDGFYRRKYEELRK